MPGVPSVPLPSTVTLKIPGGKLKVPSAVNVWLPPGNRGSARNETPSKGIRTPVELVEQSRLVDRLWSQRIWFYDTRLSRRLIPRQLGRRSELGLQ